MLFVVVNLMLGKYKIIKSGIFININIVMIILLPRTLPRISELSMNYYIL